MNPRHPFKYRVKPYRVEIEQVEIMKESEHFVWTKVGNFREAKRSSYTTYYDTFAQAKQALIVRTEANIEHFEDRIRRAKNDLEAVKRLQEGS